MPANAVSPRRWLITGCSSGIGRALAEAVLARGQQVICTARDVRALDDLVGGHPDRALPLRLDVTDPDGVRSVVKAALDWRDGLDVLVNNAGYGLVGAVEEFDETAIALAFDANVYGPWRLIRQVLPGMRAQGRGHILNVSSMAGFVGSAGFGIYSATKFALEGMSEALAQEVAPLGIKVTMVEPGPFRTGFRGQNLVAATPMDAYAETVGRFRQMLDATDGKQPGDPALAAKAIIAAVESSEPPLRLPLGEVCLQAMRRKLAAVGTELDRWQAVALATSFGS